MSLFILFCSTVMNLAVIMNEEVAKYFVIGLLELYKLTLVTQ